MDRQKTDAVDFPRRLRVRDVRHPSDAEDKGYEKSKGGAPHGGLLTVSAGHVMHLPHTDANRDRVRIIA